MPLKEKLKNNESIYGRRQMKIPPQLKKRFDTLRRKKAALLDKDLANHEFLKILLDLYEKSKDA